jgi:hypothetical protein
MEPQVTRTILAVATALLAAPTLFASAAEACIACEYVPEVVRGSQTSDPPAHQARERANTVERGRSARPARHIVRSEPAAKRVETSETAPVKKDAKNENSSISVAAAAAAIETAKVGTRTVRSQNSSISVTSTEVAATQNAKVSKALGSENSSIALASTEVAATEKAPVVETAKQTAAKPVDCKKFFPTIGATITVPCE